mmetsp:Transcript_58431/g.186276  ORF Transcript_58431/g.186276 Transcript_58431/m.186276 type:complete len:101 (-) Transcript_58431:928-1230(-)
MPLTYDESTKLSSEENERLKMESLAKCKAEEDELLSCIKEKRGFYTCLEINTVFWQCYQSHRVRNSSRRPAHAWGFGQTKAALFLDQLFGKGGSSKDGSG